jgi:hypothetical protein
MRTVAVDERRARLARRHHLASSARAATPVDAARSLIGFHATDPSSVYLAAAARIDGLDVAAVERALYDERTLVRMLGMRRTMFTVPIELMPVIDAACTWAIAARERKRLIQFVEAGGVTNDGARWLGDVEQATLAALAEHGEATANQLVAAVPALKAQVLVNEGKSYGGLIGVSTRVLTVMAAEGRIVRGRPRGSWISSQHRWAPLSAWLPEGLPPTTTVDAQVDLIRRWLGSYGPGTMADLRWWTGLTARDVSRALDGLAVTEVALDGAVGMLLTDDAEPVDARGDVEPWVALLPALDATVMGWKERDWFLGEHGPHLFDRNGNAGPTVWCDGRVVGGWGQHPDGEIVWVALEDVGREATEAIDRAAESTARFIGAARITPRFRTPVERDLGSSPSPREQPAWSERLADG